MATGDHDWAVSEVVSAANMDDYVQLQVVGQYATAAARDAALSARKREGMVTYQLDTNTLTIYSGTAWSTIGPGHGALIPWTPVISQGATPTFTNTRSVYSRVGRQITGSFQLSVTGAGTAANLVSVSIPFTAVGTNDLCFVGTGKIYDASSGFEYPCNLVLSNTTNMKFQTYVSATSVGAYLGTSVFTAALAAGDAVVGQFQYEAATDA